MKIISKKHGLDNKDLLLALVTNYVRELRTGTVKDAVVLEPTTRELMNVPREE